MWLVRQGFLEEVPSELCLKELRGSQQGMRGWRTGWAWRAFGDKGQLEQRAQRGETASRTMHSENRRSSAVLDVMVMEKRVR